jgi:hypothetical protein
VTVAPSALATWTPHNPTPPDAPLTSTADPGRTPAVSRSACTAVTAVAGTAAASTMDSPEGLRSTSSSGSATSSACAPQSCGIIAKTASPGRSRVTPVPTRTTSPATSQPSTTGNFTRMKSFTSPSRNCQSIGFTLAACTRTSTSPSAGSGAETSRNWRTSGPPYRPIITAFTPETIPGRGPRRHVRRYPVDARSSR